MTQSAKPRSKDPEYVPYSDWSYTIVAQIKILTDEVLDRFKDDKKTNTEILKLLSKLQQLVEKKYQSK